MTKIIVESEDPLFAILRDERQFIVCFQIAVARKHEGEAAATAVEGTFVQFMKDVLAGWARAILEP